MKSLGFDSEEQLVQALIACIKRVRHKKYRFETEVDAGVGIADLVLFRRAARSTASLRALGNITPRLAVILSEKVGEDIANRSELAAVLGISENAAQRVIAKLSIVGIAKQSQESLSILTVKNLPFDRLIAVEAKISDWQRVLVQSYRNLQFADESWVVLDHNFIQPALSQLSRFNSHGVGLASIDRQKGLYIHHAPSVVGPMSLGKKWQAQAVLASRLLKKSTAS